ncbi:MAG: hypothetical protein J3R72DRAFT_521579, partial [Linnemannia gamsii]
SSSPPHHDNNSTPHSFSSLLFSSLLHSTHSLSPFLLHIPASSSSSFSLFHAHFYPVKSSSFLLPLPRWFLNINVCFPSSSLLWFVTPPFPSSPLVQFISPSTPFLFISSFFLSSSFRSVHIKPPPPP